jgi:hypothetical protein
MKAMAEIKPLGNVTYRRLTNEEAVAEYGSPIVFVGNAPVPRGWCK